MPVNQLVKLLLATAGYLAGQPAWAQRAAVAPLAPLPPVVRPMSSTAQLLGVPVDTQPRREARTTIFQERLTARRSSPEPIYLLNSHFIINELVSINPRDIADIHVYKGADAPVQWRSLTEHGIIDITLKPGVRLKLKSKSLAAIRRQAKVSGPVSFQLNGLRLEDSSLRIGAAIAGLDVSHSDGTTVINIRLAPPLPSPPRHDPPGTIYIRGVASR